MIDSIFKMDPEDGKEKVDEIIDKLLNYELAIHNANYPLAGTTLAEEQLKMLLKNKDDDEI